MKYVLFSAFAAVVSVNAIAQCSDSVTAKDYAHAEQYLYYNTYKLVDHGRIYPHWISANAFWYSDPKPGGNDYILVDASTGKKSVVSRNDLTKEDFGRQNRNEVISPDGTKAAFIKDYNLWVRDVATGKETQLTTDGVKDFGYATDNAGWKHSNAPILRWSPDSKKIATFQQDQRKVGDMYLVSTNVGHPKLEAWKYPLPGDSNIITIQRVIINVDDPKVIRLQIPADPHRGTLSDDVSSSGTFDDVDWNPNDNELAFVSTSRDHKVEKFRIANTVTGEVRDVFTESAEFLSLRVYLQ